MKRTIAMSVALVLAGSLAASARADGTPPAGGAPPAPQTPAAGNAKDTDAAQWLKDLKPQLAKMADQDAKAAIKKLVEIWKDKEVSDETKKPIPDLLEHFGMEEKTLVAIDAIDGLGELSPLPPAAAAAAPGAAPGKAEPVSAPGAAPVLAILERALKAKEPSVDIYGSCLRALKKLADTKGPALKTLQDLLKYKMDDVVGKAADALGGYSAAPGKIRRDLLEELIKQTEGTCAQAKDAKNANQVRKWNIISANVMNSINALSGQKFKDVQEARKWFNDHKKDKSWDT